MPVMLEFIAQAAFAGILATYCLIAMALWCHRLGLPRLDFSKVMTMNTYGDSFDGAPPPYFAGQFLIYMNGIFFALLYATAIHPLLPEIALVAGTDTGVYLIKGMIWGVILFLASGLIYVPIFLREGVFLSKVHKNAWISSLLVHGIYGLVIGWLSPVL